ncbi:MAG: nicotinate (nicotinamide) nucleotide adenylyltransferase [Caulobacteraceae bacterium]|nr:MAG: nicotinate (nicotinamide) nucleotide adenylyltransferase [Caulobacteraceae bacterium]
MRVGLLGGSFNPPHEGHLHVADTARNALGLHKVVWLVSPQNPLKGTVETAPQADRISAVRRLARPPVNAVTGIEADLGSPYTVDTLAWLRRRWPSVRFFWLMGSDNLMGLTRWRRWRDLPRLVEVAVAPRPGSSVRGRLAPGGRLLARSGRARFLEAPFNMASSTKLRERAKARL